jgi:hypothetical protein
MIFFHLKSIQMPPDSGCRSMTQCFILRSLLHARNKRHPVCSFPLLKWAQFLPLFSSKQKYWWTLLVIDRFSSTVSSPLPPPPYKRQQEPHNPTLHSLLTFLWVSLMQELALVGAQVTAANTPRCPTASVAPPPWAMVGEVPGEPLFSPSIHGELPCITATAHSYSDEFLPSQVHRESNVSHSL